MESWVNWAIHQVEADFNRSADTHLIKLELPILTKNNIDLYLKDESTHPTGSLKHRLARSLFLYGLVNSWINKDTTIIEASSGSTAISEAYFARLLNLPFIAVIPEKTAKKKIEEIEFYGGKCHFVNGTSIYDEANRLAKEVNGHYMDQFTFAERATDWRGNNNIAESIFDQMKEERYPVPKYIIVGAGTGGTSATIGRYIRYSKNRFDERAKLIVADPENSVFYDFFKTGNKNLSIEQCSRIEGIGRPRVEPSFIPSVVDEMIQVNDSASIAMIHFLEKQLGKKCGASTGTNIFACFELIAQMIKRKQSGSIVTMLCDSGERYLDSYYNQEWLTQNSIDLKKYSELIENFISTGELS